MVSSPAMTGKIRAYGLWEDARYMIISHTSFVMDKKKRDLDTDLRTRTSKRFN